jgi:hypothetical protein
MNFFFFSFSDTFFTESNIRLSTDYTYKLGTTCLTPGIFWKLYYIHSNILFVPMIPQQLGRRRPGQLRFGFVAVIYIGGTYSICKVLQKWYLPVTDIDDSPYR